MDISKGTIVVHITFSLYNVPHAEASSEGRGHMYSIDGRCYAKLRIRSPGHGLNALRSPNQHGAHACLDSLIEEGAQH
jgi:hypothetical protein